MAGNLQFATTATLDVAAATCDPLRPALRVLTPGPWRTGMIGTTLYIDAGDTVSALALYLDNTSYAAYLLSTSDGVVDTPIAAGTIPYDDRTGRRKGYFVLTPASSRHFVLILGTPDASAPVPAGEIGYVALVTAVRTLSQNPSYPDEEVMQVVTGLPYAGGGGERNVEGHPRLQYTFPQDAFDLSVGAILDDLQALQNIPAGQPLILYENRDEAQYAYVVERLEDFTVTERVSTAGVDALVFREVW